LKVHGINEDGKIACNQQTIDAIVQPLEMVSSKEIRRAVCKWIIDRRHAFTEVESESFRNMVYTFTKSKSILNRLPNSGKTIRRDIFNIFAESKPIIKQHLQMAISQIHLSFDLSTSANHKALLAITAHWTSPNYAAIATLLAIKELHGSHTGANISELIYSVAEEYDIIQKLGFFQMDNADNNDTSLVWLNTKIVSSGGVGFDSKERRLRCFAHILNLAVQALLFGPKGAPKSASNTNGKLLKMILMNRSKIGKH
jgi:hypothetical protein